MTAGPTPTTRWFSLRRRLLLWLLGGVTAGWLAALAFSYADAHHEIDELFDAQMVQVAQTLLALASEYDDDDDVARLGTDGHKYQKNYLFQLWDEDQHLLLRSPQAPTHPLTAKDGFSESVDAEGVRWRYYSQPDRQGHLRVQVAESHRVREALSGQIALRLLLPALIGMPLLGIWIWLATRRGLAPVNAIAAEVAQRVPQQLEAVVPRTAPEEVRPLLEAINALLGRVRQALDNERRFTADAAHELRTPLAAIVAQSQVANAARDDAERAQALRQIALSGERARRLVDQLLILARLDPGIAPAISEVRLDLLAVEVCADQAAAAVGKDITLELDAPQPSTVQGNADLLHILLRNLLDNAIRYTPAGGKVGVGVTAPDPNSVFLMVSDSGPGIPAADRERALQRFHRLAGQEIAGSGLGLSIVNRIAELHGASLHLADAPVSGGLLVRVVFPVVPQRVR